MLRAIAARCVAYAVRAAVRCKPRVVSVCGVCCCRLCAACARYRFQSTLCGCAAKQNGGMGSPANAMLRVSATTVRMHRRGAAASSPRKQQGRVEQLRSVGEAGPHAEESTIETECTMGNSLRRKLRRITEHSPSNVSPLKHGVGPALDPHPGADTTRREGSVTSLCEPIKRLRVGSSWQLRMLALAGHTSHCRPEHRMMISLRSGVRTPAAFVGPLNENFLPFSMFLDDFYRSSLRWAA